MRNVMFFVDGYYLYRQLRRYKASLWVDTGLLEFCQRHLMPEEERLVRIFYYDAPPLREDVVNPLGHTLQFSKTAHTVDNSHAAIKQTPFVTFRTGDSAWYDGWVIRQDALQKLLSGEYQVEDLQDADFSPAVKQKGVDMAFGIDVATAAVKHQAERIVLVANDLDFLPAVEFATREGIQVTLDPVGNRVHPRLEHAVDWICNALRPEDINEPGMSLWQHKKSLPTP